MAVAKNAEKFVKLTDDLGFSVQPTKEELNDFSAAGFKSVINMRFDWEKGFIPEEKDILAKQNIQYFQKPIDQVTDFTDAYVDDMIKTIDESQKPVLVHCNVGLTAAVVSLVFAAKKLNTDGTQVINWGKEFGYNFAYFAELYNFINNYMQKK